MKIFVTGQDTPIGKELIQRGYEPLRCDVLDIDDVIQAVNEANPEIIIHCAEMSNLDDCEHHLNEAMAMNMRSANNLLHSFYGTFVYLSTSHVFSGEKWIDYKETHRPNPISNYGFTKWAGEKVASFRGERTLVIRTSELFNRRLIDEFLFHLRNGTTVDCDTTAKRSFLYVPHFVDGLVWVVERLNQFPKLDILNISGKDTMNYYELMVMMAKVFNENENLLIPVRSEDSIVPKNGGLNIGKARKLGVPLYSALDGLKQIKEEMRDDLLYQWS